MKRLLLSLLLMFGMLVPALAQQIVDSDVAQPTKAAQRLVTKASSVPYYKMGPDMPYERYSYEQLIAKGHLRGSYTELKDSPARRRQANRLKAAGVLRTVTAFFSFRSFMWRGGDHTYRPGKSKATATPAGESCYVYANPVSVRRYHVRWKGKPAVQQWGWFKYYAHEQCVNPLLEGAPPAYVVEVVTIPVEEEAALDVPCPETPVGDKINYVDRCEPVPAAPSAQIIYSPVYGEAQRVVTGFTRTIASIDSFTYYQYKGGKCINQGVCVGGPPSIDVPPPVNNPVVKPPPNPNENPKPDPVVPNPGASGGTDGPGNGGSPINVPVTRGGNLVLLNSARPLFEAAGLFLF